MGTHKIYSGIQGIRDNISGSLHGDCHELLAETAMNYLPSGAAKGNGGLNRIYLRRMH